MGKNKNNQKKKQIKNINTILIISSIILFIMSIITFCIYNKEYYYPKWSNGDKINIVNGEIINRFVDENTGDVYSCIKYRDIKNRDIEKWFLIDLENEKSTKVYYVIDNPIEQSRLTSPHNNFVVYVLPILFFTFLLLDICIIHYLVFIKRKKYKNK